MSGKALLVREPREDIHILAIGIFRFFHVEQSNIENIQFILNTFRREDFQLIATCLN